MHLTKEQREHILQLSQNIEKRTGIQFLAAVVGKCDAYPEIPWKAFAMGASVGALVAMVHVVGLSQWLSVASVWMYLVWVMGVGALGALLTVFWAGFARLFLDKERAALETLQHAHGLFLEHELYSTSTRTAILLLVGLFEHQVVILPDTGLKGHLSPEIFKGIIDTMVPHLQAGNQYEALAHGIAAVEEALVMAGFEGSADDVNAIPDILIEEKGDD